MWITAVLQQTLDLETLHHTKKCQDTNELETHDVSALFTLAAFLRFYLSTWDKKAIIYIYLNRIKTQ